MQHQGFFSMIAKQSFEYKWDYRIDRKNYNERPAGREWMDYGQSA